MRYWSNERSSVGGISSELLTTVEETDTWIDDNQAGYLATLTHGANYNATQKTLIFCTVAMARVSIAFLRRVFGEVD